MVPESKEDILRNKGLIFDIQRFSIHDGPGIRTLVFFKGCGLRCRWCSNPEGQEFEIQQLFDKRKCSLCLECIKSCPQKANELENGNIIYHRDQCILCGKCVSYCISGARNISGKWMKVSEILDIVNEDEVFFRNSGGGVTLGGGEPAYQYDFMSELLQELKNHNINTAIETSGYIEWKKLEILLDKIDWIIFDLKHIDDKKHRKYTGVSNKVILENLERLLKIKKNVIVRQTLVPGFNDAKKEREQIISYIRSLDDAVIFDYLNYHELGKFKYGVLGREYECDKTGVR